MVSLEQHLTDAACDEKLKELILLLSQQAKPIKDAFVENQDYAGTTNMHGDNQMELDKWADEHLIKILRESQLIKTIASEEQEDIIEVITPDNSGFGVTLDPLDGSSLIAVNLAVGTIIGIYGNGDVLEKGKNMKAAAYILYGPLTVLVYTIKNGVHEFVLNDSGEFVLLRENITMPEGKLYSPGGLKKDHTEKHAKFIQKLEENGHKLRYSGSFVADFHQILRYGGIFSYPALKEKEDGKLRLLFEANPIGFIARQAGGEVSTGLKDILEITPTSIDQRVPIYVGNKSKIKDLEEHMKEDMKDEKEELRGVYDDE
ncbi:MAG: fructose-1,6-bisphosphatase [Candidatus Aenigmarchaeota archaeon]|nr:fructose-1,6-bisphosphatase [Candidatus Aenigmarchaeota archaeon]